MKYLIEDWAAPRNQVFMAGQQIIAHPSVVMTWMNNGRTPLWTRHMLGVQEAERAKRKAVK